MSLAINATTPEGIVLAADSRQSYRNQKGMARIGSDSAFKVFKINNRIGAAVTGLAFLPENGVLKNISKFIEEFTLVEEVNKLEVQAVAVELKELFDKKYNWKNKMNKLPEQIKKDLKSKGLKLIKIEEKDSTIIFEYMDKQGNKRKGTAGVDRIDIIVAGYNTDGSHEVYTLRIPGKIEKKRDSSQKGKEYGSSWIGQIDVVSRIILGFDGRIGNIRILREARDELGKEIINKQLRNLEYVIQWGTMTLQDAVDFCVLMIKTTSAIQRFSDGIKADPGSIPGVGGPVDVAIITPNEEFGWIAKKELQVQKNEN